MTGRTCDNVHDKGTRRIRHIGRGVPLVLAVLLVALPRTGDSASILDSRHNLSVSGPGTVKAAAEAEVCIFCHTPHGATQEAPLWNRYSAGTAYTRYTSSTAKATFGQPTGASKLCLSCHDGTVALGMVRSRATQIPFSGGIHNMPPGRSNLGTDLSDDHPISFVYDGALAQANGELHSPATLAGPVRLDDGGRVQCTTCHDPHDDQFGKFLVRDNHEAALCTTCHDKDHWQEGVHRTSQATWNGNSVDPWPDTKETTVAGNACQNCHTPHAAGTPERLLVFAGERENCYSCHNGNVAADDIESVFAKLSMHPVSVQSGVHDPTENVIPATRHVTCVDCHNPHAAQTASATAPAASGALAGVTGVGEGGSAVRPLTRQYELCFRCHGDGPDRGSAHVERQFPQTNTRLEFTTGDGSYHPVVNTGRNSSVPSLIDPHTESSIVYCTDCHNNNGGPGGGGDEAAGPHGSTYAPILERQLTLTDGSPHSPPLYALCYKCHSHDSILANESFPEHYRHIVEQQTACTTCHDPHGSESNTHLINFNVNYVSRSQVNSRIEFVDGGSQTGNCSLFCHGKDHAEQVYPVVE